MSSTTCYYYNGTASPYSPCNRAEGLVSMCCASWDICQPNGLCFNQAYNIYWRESCNDPTWKDPNCIKLFVNGTNIADVTVTPCGDGSFCSGSGNNQCCNAGEGVFILDGVQTTQNPNSISSSSTTAALTSSTSTSTAAATTTAHTLPSSGLSSSAKIAIGVAVPLASILFVLLGVYAFLRHRKQKNTRNNPHPGASEIPATAVREPKKESFLHSDVHEAPADQHYTTGSKPLVHHEMAQP